MALPKPCERCGPDGFWAWTRNGMKRCDCERGQALKTQDLLRRLPPVAHVEPKISEESAATGVSMLSAMKFFPAEAGARMVIADELSSLCNDDLQVLWLAKRMCQLFTEWPGLPALRALFWSKYVPLDRRPSTSGDDALFPDGVPPEIPEQDASPIALPPGRRSVDPELDTAIRDLGKLKKIN